MKRRQYAGEPTCGVRPEIQALRAIAVLLFSAAATLVVVPITRWEQYFGDMIASTVYGQNWHLASVAVDYFASENEPSPVQHYWSLSAEEQFYDGAASGTYSATVTLLNDKGAKVASCDTGAVRWTVRSDKGRVYAGSTSQDMPIVVQLDRRRTKVTELLMGWGAACSPTGDVLTTP